MGPEQLAHWKAADAAFDQWLDQPEAERDAWLAARDLPGPVRQRLQQLVAAHRKPRRSMDPGDGLAGQRLGDWTLASELGRGGMARSEERRVGKECRATWRRYQYKRKGRIS